MRKIFSAFVLVALIHVSCAAQQVAIGNIGKQTIDNNFLKNIQAVWPEFTFVHDTTALKVIFEKIYSLNHTIADNAKKQLPANDTIFAQVEQAKQLLEIKMLGEYYLQKQIDAITVSEAEAREYYNKNKMQYTALPSAAYFQIYLADTGKQTMATVKKMIDDRKGLKEQALQGSGEKSETLSISYESFMLTAENKYLKEIFATAQVGKFTQPFYSKDNNSFVLYYLLEYSPERIRAFEEVKTDCTGDVKNIKQQLLRTKYYQQASQNYPIKLNAAFFNTGTDYMIK